MIYFTSAYLFKNIKPLILKDICTSMFTTAYNSHHMESYGRNLNVHQKMSGYKCIYTYTNSHIH